MSEAAGKVALITGANKGIGLETARQLGKLGVTILVGAREIKLDVVNEAFRDTAAKSTEKEFGRLDILINNAGVLLDARTGNETSTTSAKILRETFETNFFAVV